MTSRNPSRVGVLLVLGISFALLKIGVLVAQAQDFRYLKEFPTVDQVLKAESSDDPKETALLQMTACSELYDLVKILAGDRQFRDLTREEGTLMATYRAAQTRIATESDKTWPGPQGNWKRFSLGVIDHYFPPTDPRFGSHTHLFQKLLPADIRTRLVDELTREGQVHDAFLKQQAEEDARFRAQSAGSPSDIMSPGNVAALNNVLMMGDSAPARRCLELGHTAMECTTKGFFGIIGALGANLDQSHMKPGLSMTGIYKSAVGPVLTFDSEKVVINSCGNLVGARHGYAIGPRADRIVLQVESRPQNFILVAGPDGKISGPGMVTIDGQVVVGHSTVYVPASADGTPAHNKTVDVLAPKTERCQLGSFVPAGSTPTVASATRQAVGMFSGQSAAAGDKVAPPPGLRFGGAYVGPSGLKITFEIDEAILDCGEAHVARPYTVENKGGHIVVTVQNGGVNVPMILQPDRSLSGSGVVDVAGRVMTGMTNAGPAFAPKKASCAVGSLKPQ